MQLCTSMEVITIDLHWRLVMASRHVILSPPLRASIGLKLRKADQILDMLHQKQGTLKIASPWNGLVPGLIAHEC